jgi:putative Ig domain-containing protein
VGTFSFVIRVTDQVSSAVSGCTVAVSAAVPTLTISTSSLPDGVSGVTYVQALSASGGQAPYTWTVSGGALPPGLSLNAAQINGTPTTSGTFQFTLRLSDAAGRNATKDLAIQVRAALTVVTSSLTPVVTGVAASQQLSAAGGVPPYLWSLVSGGLPPGLTLSPSGSISGVPNTSGSFTFTVRVTDGATASAQRAFTLAVATSLGISACPASSANQGQSYASTAVVTGGQAPYTWTLASGTLPAGILFNRSTGGLSGVPTDSGAYPYTLLITDQGGATATRDCQLVVTSSLVIGTAVLPDASVSSPYSQSLSASGGKPTYTWSIVAGNLPAGLTLSSAGVISGAALALGSFNFTVSVTDSNGASVQRALSIRVVSGLNVIGCSAAVSEAGLVFNSSVLGSGGSPPYSWNVSAGNLPPGLTLDPSSGVILGTPLQTGSVQFTVEMRDSTNHAATRQCSIDVAAPVAISTAALSNGSSGSNYSDSIAASGGSGPFVWATTAGSLPPGLSLNPASGHITGIPLVVGAFAFTAKVIDGMGGQATKDLSIVIAEGLTIPDCPNPAAVVGLSYSALLTAVGGTVPYQWKVDSGTLPPGLLLSSEQAAINGTPLQSGLSTYVLRVDDASGKSSTRLCSIQVNPPGLIITSPPSLPNGLMGTAYSQTLSATGGRAPYSWSITTAGAPSGISLDATGVLAGLPSAAGTFSFTVQVTDQDNSVVRQIATLAILAGNPPAITISGLPDIVDPDQQPTFAMQLGSGYPAAIDGTLTLVFTPDPAVGVDDPAVQFAAGGRVLTFTVPSNSTDVTWSAPVAAFQTGTVSGTIELDVKLISNGTDITPPGSSRTIRVDRLAPRIASVQVVKTSAGFDVHLIGFATTREVAQGTFQFSGDTAGATANITVPLASSSQTWFQSPDSQKFGGQFGLVQSFQWQGQPSDVLNSVSVSLTNAQGASAAVQARF